MPPASRSRKHSCMNRVTPGFLRKADRARALNTPPCRLPTPIEAEWAAAREPLLLHKPLAAAHHPSGAWPDDDADPHSLPDPAAANPYSYPALLDDAAGLSQLYAGGGGHVAASPKWNANGGRAVFSAGAESSAGGRQAGLYRPYSRVRNAPASNLPRPPFSSYGRAPPAAAQQQQQQAWGGAPDGKQRQASRWPNSFFNLDGGGGGGGGGGARAGGAGGRMQTVVEGGWPSLQQQQQQQWAMQQQQQAKPAVAVAFGRRAGRPPPSPAILRGDHLPSPDRKVRVPQHPQSAAPAFGRGAAGQGRARGGGGGGAAATAGPAPPQAGVLSQNPPHGPEAARRYVQQRRASQQGADGGRDVQGLPPASTPPLPPAASAPVRAPTPEHGSNVSAGAAVPPGLSRATSSMAAALTHDASAPIGVAATPPSA